MRDSARRKRRRRRKKKKGRTWAEAAKTVLEKYHNTPMSHKEILQVIQREGLKEISGTSPLACLNAMLHTNSRGDEGIFYKVPGRMGVYTLKKDVGDGMKDLSDCSEDSNETQSDSQTSDHSSCSRSSSSDTSTCSSSGDSGKDQGRSRWKRKVASRLPQPSSPQSGCPSPSIPAGKVISPSQKHSKKALKQALKQQQQKKNQERRVGMPVPPNQHILLKTVKTASNIAPVKPAWEAKRTGQSNNHQISPSTISAAMKANDSLQALGKKALQRSDRLQARHLKRTKCAEIDVETPESILVNTNLRALINKHTFSLLPGDCQQHLLLLLPEVDRPAGPDGIMKLNSSALNNEFFTSAAQGWKERLSEGEFTPEMQLRIRQEIEKEKKVESWKEQFYESYYGENSGLTLDDYNELANESNDSDSKLPNTLSEEQSESKPCIKVLPVKAEDESAPGSDKNVENTKPVKNEEINETQTQPASSQPSGVLQLPETDIASPKSSEPSAEGNIADNVIEKMEITNVSSSSPETKTSGLDETSSLPLQYPKSPNIAETPSSLSTKQDTHRNSSEAESPEKVQISLSNVAVKRKLDVSEAILSSPEKSPRMMEQLLNQQPFRVFCRHQTETGSDTQEQKLPRPKVTAACMSPKPFFSSWVSHGPRFPAAVTSPGRTGARTLADIKAKAQLARAQRAAAATAATTGRSVPGPGPGGGAGPGGGQMEPADRHKDRVLDMGNTGSGRSERGTVLQFVHQKQEEAKDTSQTSTLSTGRTQLLQNSSLHHPIPTTAIVSTTSTPPSSSSSLSERLIVSPTCIKKLNLPTPLTSKLITASSDSGVHKEFSCSSEVERTLFPPSIDFSATQGIKAFQGGIANESRVHSTAIKLKNEPSLAAQMTLGVPPVSLQTDAASLKSNTATVASASKAQGTDTQAGANVKSQNTSCINVVSAKASSSIPTNNTLVTQLLQGKNVSLDQIVPKPLTKGEIQTVMLPSAEKEKPSTISTRVVISGGRGGAERTANTATQQLERFFNQNRQLPSGQRIWQLFSGRDLKNISSNQVECQETSPIANQEQILQSLIKKVQQENSMKASNISELSSSRSILQRENISTSHRFMLGFVGRRTSKPAMPGHYLLNISTYGRVPESFKRSHAVTPEGGVCLNDPEHIATEEFLDDETESVTETEEEQDTESEDNADEPESVKVKSKPLFNLQGRNSLGLGLDAFCEAPARTAESAASSFDPKESVQKRGNIYDEANLARDFIQVAQAKMANVLGVRLKQNASDLYRMHSTVRSQSPADLLQAARTYSNHTGPIGPNYGGTINISTSPEGLHGSTVPASGNLASPNTDNVVSFSLTVTTIPSSQSANSGGLDQPISVQAFTEGSGRESSKCYCRLKAMIMCKGCGAFCHDDCIGPSKLCVSCLVVR
ncbi:LOW QUALITY PROTEIN: putative Polycomb group protein ASXL2 [Bombina bombina]|uniref:LOW QUALITY PROTEIN: putative Polycomb group protein ASXL2 n=1 Tax=Bombina bombina TaxID=8345 RepID=UPI00235B165E|nr:LOW QUALITY PROTEIN: putative Polycomb group protein ASXL2 [Bombina bombina]